MKKNDNYYIMTESGRKRFKVWLAKNGLSARQFAIKCGVSHQYISRVINSQDHITHKTIEIFKKGGYELI